MLYDKEQLEVLISTIKENVAMSEMLLANNPDSDNAEGIKRILEQQEKSLKNYTDQLKIINQKGHSPSITKNISLTLTEDQWRWIDEKSNNNSSKFLREIIINAMQKRET